MKRFETEQEIFDHVVNHMGNQGRPAYGVVSVYTDTEHDEETGQDIKIQRENFGCCYRTKDGLSCAAGSLLILENYDMEIEDNRFSALENDQIEHFFAPGVIDHVILVSELQTAHDTSRDTLTHGEASERFVPDVLKQALLRIAEKYDLSKDAIEPAIEKIRAFNQANPV